MSLPGQLQGLIAAAKENAAGRVPGSRTAEKEPEMSLLDLLSRLEDRRIAAYLWLAIEYGYNLVVISEDQDASRRFVGALGAFVPKDVVIQDEMQIKNIPERVVCKQNLKEIDQIFSAAKYGTSFIIQITSGKESVVKNLLSKGVKKESVKALDVSILLENGKISAITEYRWLDRSEVGRSDGMLKRFRNIAIVRKCVFDTGCIRNSKLIERYSKSLLVGVNEAAKEIYRRAEFLESVAKGKTTKIGDYYNIAATSERA